MPCYLFYLADPFDLIVNQMPCMLFWMLCCLDESRVGRAIYPRYWKLSPVSVKCLMPKGQLDWTN